jgi:hypothetical protein
MKDKKLKLFVWEDVLQDWYYGICFAIAPSVEEALELLLKKTDYLDSYIEGTKIDGVEPKVFDLKTAEPCGWILWGGS